MPITVKIDLAASARWSGRVDTARTGTDRQQQHPTITHTQASYEERSSGHCIALRAPQASRVLIALSPILEPRSEESSWRTHLRTVSALPTPSLAATDVIAAQSES